MDPEVPVLSIRELGVLRDVEVSGDDVVVVMTPTYSGCPAMHAMEADVVRTLAEHGVPNVRVTNRLFAGVDDRLDVAMRRRRSSRRTASRRPDASRRMISCRCVAERP